ncbi:MAG TPA: ATP-binding protein [Vicinamibacterales bacterium]|nr:ATP-binding protein [Vicinamibacterales bacterium]
MPGHPHLLNAAMLRWLDELSTQGVFATDTDLVICSWNRWLERNTGRPADSVIGRRLLELYPELVDRGLDRYYRAALAGAATVLSHRFHKYLLGIPASHAAAADGSMPQSARIAPLLDGAAAIGTVTVIDDVSDRVMSETALRRQIAASESARVVAEEASRVKDEFLATLSHEIRTPLNAVLGWTKILQGRSVDGATLERALEVIGRNAAAQAVLIEDMLDMSRIVSGKLRLEIGEVDPVAVTLAAIDVVSPAAAAKDITLRTSLSVALPSLRGDPDRVQQIIWNLLSNAVKFTPAGGTVHIRAEHVAGSIVISVEDTGEGIAQEFLPFVFDRFRQASSSASRLHSGLGLGLALVRQLVEMQGGAVTAASAGPGLGATFTVSFPALTVVPRQSAAVATAAQSVPELGGIRILVVDDESDARELLAAALSQAGAEVSSVASAEAALQLLESAGDRKLQLLIADIGMPGATGYELVTRLRRSETSGSRIPAVAVTAYARSEDSRKALDAGFDLHLAKPISPETLIAAVQFLMSAGERADDRDLTDRRG